MTRSLRRFVFLAFFLSGYCALVYQVIWTRLAFASFGIIAPVLSVVISVFMLGLSAGAVVGGRSVGALVVRTGRSALLFYAIAEAIIGLGGFIVPNLFALGERLLFSSGQTDSLRYLLFSALFLTAAILPWSFCMGTTFPFMMAFVREREPGDTRSFSYLYLANVLGAMTGCLLAAVVLIEMLGFKVTLTTTAVVNLLIAALSVSIGWGVRPAQPAKSKPRQKTRDAKLSNPSRRRAIKWILFSTGLSAMAMEVVWARAFTPVMTTEVYSFALIVFAYLGATFLGSCWYRRDLAKKRVRSSGSLIALLSVAAFLPIIANDLRILTNTANLAGYLSATLLLLSICPVCGLLGYLTPSLIDEYGQGEASLAGKAYALNVLGSILGPLLASYLLLPFAGERYSLILLGLPFLLFGLGASRSFAVTGRWIIGGLAIVLLGWSLFFAVDFTQLVLLKSKRTEIRRDYAASVISAGDGMAKALLVNGVGVTGLVPITKFMAHLPLALHSGKSESALVICFGMGTSYRAALRWDIDVTAIELVPSVRVAFPFYHDDADRVLANPKGRIIIDDGRRYLSRCKDNYDVIIIDPPPPVSAAGSSLLYSEEFYALAKQRLRPNGILQAWFPGGDDTTAKAVLRSLSNSFPHLRCFRSPLGAGILVLASLDPIAGFGPEEVALSMPMAAQDDLLEWAGTRNVPGYLSQVMRKEFPIETALASDPHVRITDDHPYNEYFLLRRWGWLKSP